MRFMAAPFLVAVAGYFRKLRASRARCTNGAARKARWKSLEHTFVRDDSALRAAAVAGPAPDTIFPLAL